MPTEITIVTTDPILAERLLRAQDRLTTVFNMDFAFVSWEGPRSPHTFHKIALRSVDLIEGSKPQMPLNCEEIVRELAREPTLALSGECVFCACAYNEITTEHSDNCLWRKAREWMEKNP